MVYHGGNTYDDSSANYAYGDIPDTCSSSGNMNDEEELVGVVSCRMCSLMILQAIRRSELGVSFLLLQF